MKLTYKYIDWKLYLEWSKVSDVHHYRIMAMSQTFAYSAIGTTKKLKYDMDVDKDNTYISFKIIAEDKNNCILCESNEVNVLYSEIENFWIGVLYGYHGTTLTFRTKGVYDLYKVYNNGSLVAETEDPIIELPYKLKNNELKWILVECYSNDANNWYVLRWISTKFSKIPSRDKSKYKISVVIPVYNAKIFLPRTLDSILSSSMSDIEVILVDDGSKDDSLNICKWYAKNFPCVSVISQANQRVAVARNTWIEAAKWEYIWFVDNDDVVHPLMYENLYNACKITKTDIAIATTIIRDDIRDKKPCLTLPGINDRIIVYSYDDVINNMHAKDNMYFVAIWNKIIKADIVKQVHFPTDYPNKIVLYEDSAYTPTIYSYIDKFAFSKDAYYIWDKRKQKTIGTASTMHKNENTDNVWKAFIYAYSYPMYNRNEKHWELSDYASFKRLVESYDKFDEKSSLYWYWNAKMIELIKNNKLENNKYIMQDQHLCDVVNELLSMV